MSMDAVHTTANVHVHLAVHSPEGSLRAGRMCSRVNRSLLACQHQLYVRMNGSERQNPAPVEQTLTR
jgi:hypothetical protein